MPPHHHIRIASNILNLTPPQSQSALHNHVINHIAISVPDLDAAVSWYQSCFGFQQIRSNRVTSHSTSPSAPIFRIYGDSLKKVKIAFMGTGNGVGFEIFEFIDPPHEKAGSEEFEYTKAGVFHIAVTTPDVQEAITRVKEHGGSQIGETVELGKGVSGDMRYAAYLRDPWGTVVEVLSCGFEALMANRE